MNLKSSSALALTLVCALAMACPQAAGAQEQQTASPAEAESPEQSSAPSAAASAMEATAVSADTAACCIVPALTPVELEILTAASSRTSPVGQQIRIRVVEPVMLNGRVLIPGGTEGFAEVIQASDAKLGGRAGELTIGAPYLTIGDQRIRLKRLRYGPSTGRGAETEAMVAAALVGIPGMFITGRNVEVKSGTRANAVLVADTVVSVR